MKLKTLTLIFLLYSCQSVRQELSNETAKDVVDLEHLYWGPLDSIVSNGDTRTIYNSRMDTVLTEKGIFTYLRHDYRVSSSIPDSVYYPVKKADYHSNLGNCRRTKKFHRIVVDYYQKHWPRSTKGYKWSDLNAIYSHKVNTSILISYSLDQLGLLDESIEVLKPYLANCETAGTKIHYRFLEQCIKKYGRENVKREVEQCGSTIEQKTHNSPGLDNWVVSLYGADIGINKTWSANRITTSQADSILQQMDFYTLIN